MFMFTASHQSPPAAIMIPTPSIPSRPTDKDPPPPSPPKRPTTLPPNLSSKLDTQTMPPPPRPAIPTRISFEPQSHSFQPQTDSVPQHEEGEPSRIHTPFTPFFTLINDNSTQSAHHPSKIHYIFSDDDSSELLTSSLLTSLSSQQLPHSPRGPDPESSLSLSSRDDKVGSSTTTTTSSSSSAKFRDKNDKSSPRASQRPEGPKGTGEREERVLIVDINESGDGVVSVSSLAPNWQVLNATIERAPTFDQAAAAAAADQQNEYSQEGLMLRIEGVGSLNTSHGTTGEGEGLGITKVKGGVDASGIVMEDEEMSALLEGFDSKMAVLRRIVTAGEEFATSIGEEKEKEKERETEREGSVEPPEE